MKASPNREAVCAAFRLCGRTQVPVASFYVAGGGTLMLLIAASSCLAAGDDAPQALVETVIAGITANDSQIKTLRAEFTETHERPQAEAPHEVEIYGGERVKVKGSPRVCVFHGPIFIRGNQLRYNRENSCDGTEVIWYVDGDADRWTHYSKHGRSSWVRHRAQLAGAPSFVPRDIATRDIREGLIDVLQTYRPAKASLEQGETAPVIRLTLEDMSKGKRPSFEFDGRYSFLPTRVVAPYGDGSIGHVMSLQYQPVLGGTAWVLESAKLYFLPYGRFHEETTADWTQVNSCKLTDVHVNEEISDSTFAIQYIGPTAIHDSIKHKSEFVNKPQMPGGAPLSSNVKLMMWFMNGLAVVAIGIAAGWGLRGRRRR